MIKMTMTGFALLYFYKNVLKLGAYAQYVTSSNQIERNFLEIEKFSTDKFYLRDKWKLST